MANPPLKQLVLEWDRAEDFLKGFEDGPTRRIRTAVKLKEWPETGSLCSLVLRFADRDTEFQMHAVLLMRRDGVAVFELLPEERMRHELVLVAARGESLPYRRRRHTRIPCHLVVNVHCNNGQRVSGQATTFGAGGVHLALEKPIEADQQIFMKIEFSDGRKMSLVGRVTSCIEEGPKKGNSIEFLFESSDQRKEISAIAAELETTSSQTDQ